MPEQPPAGVNIAQTTTTAPSSSAAVAVYNRGTAPLAAGCASTFFSLSSQKPELLLWSDFQNASVTVTPGCARNTSTPGAAMRSRRCRSRANMDSANLLHAQVQFLPHVGCQGREEESMHSTFILPAPGSRTCMHRLCSRSFETALLCTHCANVSVIRCVLS